MKIIKWREAIEGETVRLDLGDQLGIVKVEKTGAKTGIVSELIKKREASPHRHELIYVDAEALVGRYE